MSLGPWSIAMAFVQLVAFFWYLAAVQKLREQKGRRWPWQRTLSFAGGLLAMAAAWESSVAAYAGATFIDHVVQHVVLMLVAPILLCVGAPVTLAMQTLAGRQKARLLRFYRARWWRGVAHPIPANIGNYGLMYWFFLGGGIVIGMRPGNQWLMDGVNVGFLLFGSLVWWPIFSRDWIGRKRFAYPVRLALAVIGMPFDSFLAVALLEGAATHSVDPGVYSVANTHAGASVFWVLAGLISTASSIGVAAQWARKEARSDRRIAAALDERGVVTGGSPSAGWGSAVPVEADGTITVPWAR